jgi:hypothetical protein
MCALRHLLGQTQTKITHYCKTTKELAFSESPPSEIGKCPAFLTTIQGFKFTLYYKGISERNTQVDDHDLPKPPR